MSIVSELRNRFGGFRNGLVLILILFACLRFAGAEWNEQPLEVRVLRGLMIIGSVIALGLLFALGRVALARWESYGLWRSGLDQKVAAAAKLGVVVGGVVVFTTGVLMVEEYLGPFQGLVDNFLEWLASRLPGGG